MLSSPQILTIATVPHNCNKIMEDSRSSFYATDDGTLEFKVSHQVGGKRSRRMARLDKTVIAADPLTAQNAYQKAGVYFVIDEPIYGFTNAEIIDQVSALKDWLTSANITAMLAGRH